MKKIVFLFMMIGMIMVSCKKNNNNEGIVEPPEEEIILGDPEIISVSPLEGAPLTIITIEGENFSTKKEENEVTINGIIARIVSVTNSRIQAEVPIGGETGDVVVKVITRFATGPLFTYINIPVIVYITETYAGTYTDPVTKGYLEGDRLSAQFAAPEGIAFDSKGNLIVADRDNHVIRKITPDGQTSLLAGTPGISGSVDGAAFEASFYRPLKVALDAQDNIYVADRDNNKIRKIDGISGMVSTIAGSGERGFAEGVGAAAKFHTPSDVVVAEDGTIYVADAGNNRIRKITSDGTVSTLAGNGTRAWADGTGSEAGFMDPSGVAIDKNGNIIVADRRAHRIRKVTPAGVTTTLGIGSAGFIDGDLNTEAKFSHPFGIDIAADGTIYVVELGNHGVRMITPEGMVSTIGGTGVSGWKDGNPSQYFNPTDLAIDAQGRIYVSEISSHLIRRIVPTEL